MRKIAAHFILNPGEALIKNGIIEIDDEGTILNLRASEELREEEHLEFYSGVLIPGFINVHTHLELSHLKGKIEPGSGISGFVNQVVNSRNHHQIDHSVVRNELAKSYQGGTQAIGDIANTNDSLLAKTKSPVYSHSFIELFGLKPDMASKIWDHGLSLESEFRKSKLSANLTPHAPYSVSEALWGRFQEYYRHHAYPLSIHHMESEEENLFMQSHSGKMAEKFTAIGISEDHFPGNKQTSTEWLSNQLPEARNILLIHNTFSQITELKKLFAHHPDKNFFLGLCPKSNLFIENKLPDHIIKNRKQLSLCLGTDSLASNNSLSMWDEIKTLAKAFPEIRLKEFVEMACINGAKALNIEHQMGSFQTGKKPGVILIEGLNLQTMDITTESRTRRIV